MTKVFYDDKGIFGAGQFLLLSAYSGESTTQKAIKHFKRSLLKFLADSIGSIMSLFGLLKV
ncbi:MAG: hypothetical protein K2N27_08205 [Ruminococcus sp.]|nr:hypothetical protein [Ruminococcus sp.]